MRAALQRELDPRYVQFPACALQARTEPLVVPLGPADPLGEVTDPYAPVRARATIHLTGRTVLIGPWGGGRRSADAPCGLCLGLFWQRARTGPARNARAWGHEPEGLRARPELTPSAVEVVRSVWSAVYETPVGATVSEREGPPRAGASRVTCVDLRAPVPRTLRLLPQPECGRHTTCGG
ncbi:hypothetical protein [Streptomyces sp. TR02-1]|uniref:hypothetical protein n=1 Tax=Streptomyces sp. TR02-1 TaxID=3385977 RepID=UPI0039A14261